MKGMTQGGGQDRWADGRGEQSGGTQRERRRKGRVGEEVGHGGVGGVEVAKVGEVACDTMKKTVSWEIAGDHVGRVW